MTTHPDPDLPDDLLRRLRALGGLPTGAPVSPWGSYEIITPAGVPYKHMWVTPLALAALLDEWEAEGGHCERLAIWLFRGEEDGG
jgi:hypothetical protein